jgi:hypothetical protein
MQMIKLGNSQDYAFVDDEDYDKVKGFSWYKHQGRHTFYPRTTNRGGNKYMHHLIVDVPKGLQIDHINGFGWDNCRKNLRIVTLRGNTQNKHIEKSSKFPGVTLCKDQKRRRCWMAQITYKGHRCMLGRYFTEEEAFKAYSDACMRLGVECSYVGGC